MARRPVWAEIDLSAIRDNTASLVRLASPARLCAVVKAFAYGHGPVRAAEAALAGGAEWLGVATVEEGVALRQAGITEPVLLLSEAPASAMGDAVSWKLTPTLYTPDGVKAAAEAVAVFGANTPFGVHVKVDTGMHRVGAAPAEAIELARAVAHSRELGLEGLFTHFAVADELDDRFTQMQIERFEQVCDALADEGIRPPLRHASNSAGTLAYPQARYDLVRCGIALYGIAPSEALASFCPELRPALSLKARVTYVKEVEAGERISYGLRYTFGSRSLVATVPIGYADGVPRRYFDGGGEVLIGGRRRRVAGTVTMDQITVDCEDDSGVSVGDEVVLLGRQDAEEITAWEWARRIGTIAYEVTCGIGARVPRVYLSGS